MNLKTAHYQPAPCLIQNRPAEVAACRYSVYYQLVIRSFGDTRTEALFARVPPSNQLEKLKGDPRDFHSIRANDQWRLIFKWHAGDAYEVRIVDYHPVFNVSLQPWISRQTGFALSVILARVAAARARMTEKGGG